MTSAVYEKQTDANANSHITETCIDTSMNSKGMPAQVLVPTNVGKTQRSEFVPFVIVSDKTI